MTRPITGRIAGAPITWGVCEVPGWGYQLEPHVVLTQMRELGLRATELGPEGFLPADPQDAARVLTQAGLTAVGQFVPVVLHDPGVDPLPRVLPALGALMEARATTLVLAAATGLDGYDARPELDEAQWQTLLQNLDRLAGAAAARGLVPCLHPHVGTMIESAQDVERVLRGSRIGLCLDTGHLLIGGADPVVLAQDHPDRVAHVHLKDVDLDRARDVQQGVLTYTQAVRAGMYRPLGHGDLDLRTLVAGLEAAGYDGWYVLEQDTVLAGDPAHDPSVPDPVDDARASVACLTALGDEVAG